MATLKKLKKNIKRGKTVRRHTGAGRLGIFKVCGTGKNQTQDCHELPITSSEKMRRITQRSRISKPSRDTRKHYSPHRLHSDTTELFHASNNVFLTNNTDMQSLKNLQIIQQKMQDELKQKQKLKEEKKQKKQQEIQTALEKNRKYVEDITTSIAAATKKHIADKNQFKEILNKSLDVAKQLDKLNKDSGLVTSQSTTWREQIKSIKPVKKYPIYKL
jgi:hypothetical protein